MATVPPEQTLRAFSTQQVKLVAEAMMTDSLMLRESGVGRLLRELCSRAYDQSELHYLRERVQELQEKVHTAYRDGYDTAERELTERSK